MRISPNYIILVAEDDEDDRLLLMYAFARHQTDCQIRFFSNGQELLDELLNPETRLRPSLIVLDLNMPVSDGLTTLRALKSDTNLCMIPVLILTTSDSPDDVKRCYDAGANAYFTKPISFKDMVRQIDMTLQFWLKTAILPTSRPFQEERSSFHPE